MIIDAAFRKYIATSFAPLNSVAAARGFPEPGALVKTLEEKLKLANRGANSASSLTPTLAAYFATAAVDIWHRGIQSFLVSAALTETSAIWSSVAGYYSSHYSMRAIAHLLGYFQLFHQHKQVTLELTSGGAFTCTFDSKGGRSREHTYYWQVVTQHPYFSTDPLFTPGAGTFNADVSHRDFSNYRDHLQFYRPFSALDGQAIKDRIDHISRIPFVTALVPDLENFPDLDTVQIVAYQRIVRFRKFVDETLGGKNRFWTVHRDPSWARGYVNFQVATPGSLSSLMESI